MQYDKGTPQQVAIRPFQLDQMSKMIQSFKMNNRAKKILSHYHGLHRTIWSQQEQDEAREAYKHSMGKKSNNDTVDKEMD